MNLSTPEAAVEGFDVIPDRSVIQGLVRHPRHEGARGEGFPFDVTNSFVSGFRDMQPELQTSNAGAQCDALERVLFFGMYSHTTMSVLEAPGFPVRAPVASKD